MIIEWKDYMKKALKYLDKPLFFISIILFIIGLVMVFSASNVTAYASGVSPYNYFIKQAIFLGISFVWFIFLINIDTKTYTRLSWFLLIVFVAAMAILLVVGKAKNRAVSWYDFGFFSVQPSEFIKIIIIVWLAGYYERNVLKLDRYGPNIFPLVVCAVIALLIFLQPDFGTMLIFVAIVGVIFLAQPIKKSIKYRIIFIGLCLVAFGAITAIALGKDLLAARQKSRFDFMRPCDKLLSTGNQVCNAYIAINNGGLTGVGLGNSTQKYLYLPEPYTDFIYAIIVEELGAIFGIFIIILYMILLYRILAIGRRSSDNSGKTICYGVAIYIFLHIAVNLLGLFGLIPMTGVPLPFMSYGGSFTICLATALTMVQRVSVENKLAED
jgi:cell division protein FtsW